jgi:hypothetical protein
MVRLSGQQRAAFGESLLELANFAAAALVFGQFVGQQPASWKVIVAGVTAWLVLISTALLAHWRSVMENAFGILFGIAFVALIIALLDWLGRRKDRHSRNRAA